MRSGEKVLKKFSTARLTDEINANSINPYVTTDISHGALLDDGAPYAANSKFELQLVAKSLLPK